MNKLTSNRKFQYGRRPPKRHVAIQLRDVLTGVVPAHPVSEDYLNNVSGWKILGNDNFSDCLAVAWANMRYFITSMLTDHPYYPTLEQVYEIYKTQNPGFVPDPNNPVDDNGMDIQTLCEYLTKNAGPDGAKLIGFASVDVTNLNEVKAALAIFGCLMLGIEVQETNIQDFNNGQPWNYHPGDTIDGGHAVLAGGYLTTPGNDVRFITWAQQTGMTDAFWNNLVARSNTGEGWVCIWEENLGTKAFQEGINLQTLAADYQALTDRPFPVPVPTPTPIPTPTPAPVPNPVPTPTPVPTPSPLIPPAPPAGGVAWAIEFLEWLITFLKNIWS